MVSIVCLLYMSVCLVCVCVCVCTHMRACMGVCMTTAMVQSILYHYIVVISSIEML